MIETIKDDDGKVVSFLEYYILNGETKFDSNGEFLYVNECWVHESVRHNNIINYYVQKIVAKFLSVETVYWVRHKYNRRMSIYNVKRGDTIKLIRGGKNK